VTLSAPADAATGASAERSLTSYLLLPRPDEAKAKMPMAALVYGLVQWADGAGGTAAAAAVVAWLAFELVLYQARYILNDLADAEVDRLHTAAAARGRLPAGEHARLWAQRAIVARVLLWAAVVVALPPLARNAGLLAAAGLVVATAAYEAARAPMRRPTPPSSTGAAIFALVGAGYAVRIGLGAALAGGRATVVVSAAAFGWLFGTLGVVLAWTLEAAGLRAAGDTTVTARKAHIGTIARLVTDLDHPLLHGLGAQFAGAWALAALVAATAFGSTLTDTEGLAVIPIVVIAAAVLTAWPSPWAGAVATAAVTGAALATAGPEMAMLLLVVSGTVSVARTFTPATIDLD